MNINLFILLKIIGILTCSVVLLFALSSMLAYWWGLSNIDSPLIPSNLQLSTEQKKAVWLKLEEVGEPNVKPILPYGYLLALYCKANTVIDSPECAAKYLGIRVAAQAIRKQIGSKRKNKRNIMSHLTWSTVWVANNWSTDQVIATYYEVYGAVPQKVNGQNKWP